MTYARFLGLGVTHVQQVNNESLCGSSVLMPGVLLEAWWVGVAGAGWWLGGGSDCSNCALCAWRLSGNNSKQNQYHTHTNIHYWHRYPAEHLRLTQGLALSITMRRIKEMTNSKKAGLPSWGAFRFSCKTYRVNTSSSASRICQP